MTAPFLTMARGSGRGGAGAADPLTQFLPAGMTLFCDTTLGNIDANSYNVAGLRGNYDFRNVSDPTAPWGPDCYEMFYLEGDMGGGDGGGWLYCPPNQGWRRVYWGLSAYLPANYVTWQEKLFYPRIATPGYEQLSSYISMTNQYSGGASTSPQFGFNLLNQLSAAPTQNRIPPSPTTAAQWTKGQWVTLACYAEMNTPEEANGVCQLWVNGQEALSFTDVTWSNHPVQGTFDWFLFNGTRGGGVADTPVPPGGQYRRYNRLAFYGSAT